MLEKSVARHGAKTAVEFFGAGMTYAQLGEQVQRAAEGLRIMGVQAGDRVALVLPNCPQHIVAFYAVLRLGAIVVEHNPLYTAPELRHQFEDHGARVVIAWDKIATSITRMPKDLAVEHVVAVDITESMSTLMRLGLRLPLKKLAEQRRELTQPAPGAIPWRTLASHEPLRADHPRPVAQDIALLQYTSGTTGFPKGATLSHYNILNNGYMVGESLGLTEHDRMVIPVPLYHCFGMVMGNLGCMTHGSTMIYPNDAFDPALTLQTVAEERATALYGVPTMFIAVLDQPQRADYDLSCLRTGIMAGAICPIEVMRRVISELHMSEVQIAYGMTETSPVSLQTGPDDELEVRVTTVGRTQPQLESKIVDEHGCVVARGQIGELCTRGYSVMLGYWGNPSATAEAIDPAGWMHTGDLASMDEQGYVCIAGRNKDMIIRGGENIYPRELEEFFFTHPAVADVQVIGIPDERYGEEIVAWIKFHPGHTATDVELQAWCKSRIAHFKTPRHFRFVDEFPMTVTGKVQKFRMREISIEELKRN
ncbi:MAG TPA: AMP-binding protein [Pseudomonas sp.]|nr:AMP-binding protein [Pseudomonas sp.]